MSETEAQLSLLYLNKSEKTLKYFASEQYRISV